jgi:Uncharacterized metal-binding protein
VDTACGRRAGVGFDAQQQPDADFVCGFFGGWAAVWARFRYSLGAVQRWGWFRWIWIPYRGSLKHRSPLSHAPITGTFVRILYLLAWVGAASFFGLALLNQIWQLGWTWGDIGGVIGRSLQTHAWAWLTFCGGLELGALSHYTADYLVSSSKRFKTKGWRAFLPKTSKSRKPRRRTTASRKRRS